ncbi:MAG: hypothetical protein U1F21_05750 [Sphaerotilus natans]
MAALFLWISVLALLALWSLTVWARSCGGGLGGLECGGALSGTAADIAAIRLPPWLEFWVPREVLEWLPRMLADLAPLIDSLLQAVPALAGGLTALAWGVWVLGGLLLVLLGIGLQIAAGVAAALAFARRRPIGGCSGSGGSGRPLDAGSAPRAERTYPETGCTCAHAGFHPDQQSQLRTLPG